MFQYIYPQFERKRLLRVEMLEALRDRPDHFLKGYFSNYGEGVVEGCLVSWERKKLMVGPGILLHRGCIYQMNEPRELDCPAEDRLRYLKVRYGEEERENGLVIGKGELVLESEKPDPARETELCRFRLQEGARLRDAPESFADYSTEYDTVNLIHAPYAQEGGSTLNPRVLRAFAREMMRGGGGETVDLIFSMNILSSSGHVPPECIREYLYLRSGEEAEGNARLYQGLLKVLGKGGSGSGGKDALGQRPRGVMLL